MPIVCQSGGIYIHRRSRPSTPTTFKPICLRSLRSHRVSPNERANECQSHTRLSIARWTPGPRNGKIISRVGLGVGVQGFSSFPVGEGATTAFLPGEELGTRKHGRTSKRSPGSPGMSCDPRHRPRASLAWYSLTCLGHSLTLRLYRLFVGVEDRPKNKYACRLRRPTSKI